jgi:hypothetical protein
MATEMNIQLLVSLPRTKKLDANAKSKFVNPPKNPGQQRAVPVTVTIGEGENAQTVKLTVPLTVFGRSRMVKGQKVKVKGDGAIGGVSRDKVEVDMSLFGTLVPIVVADEGDSLDEMERVEDVIGL